MVGAIDDEGPILAPERATVVPQFVGQLAETATISIHGVDLQVTTPQAGEDNRSLGIDRRFRVIPRAVGQPSQAGPVQIGPHDLEARKEGPDVAQRIVRFGRTLRISEERRRIDDRSLVRGEVGASGLPLAVGDPLNIRSVQVHREDLVATVRLTRSLKDQFFAIRREVGLRVLPFEGQLSNVGKALLARIVELPAWPAACRLGRLGGGRGAG